MAKKKRTREDVEAEEKTSLNENEVQLPATISSDEPPAKIVRRNSNLKFSNCF